MLLPDDDAISPADDAVLPADAAVEVLMMFRWQLQVVPDVPKEVEVFLLLHVHGVYDVEQQDVPGHDVSINVIQQNVQLLHSLLAVLFVLKAADRS